MFKAISKNTLGWCCECLQNWAVLVFLMFILNTLTKKETLAQVFSCEFSENSKNTFIYRNIFKKNFFTEHLRLLLLNRCNLNIYIACSKSFFCYIPKPIIPSAHKTDIQTIKSSQQMFQDFWRMFYYYVDARNSRLNKIS